MLDPRTYRSQQVGNTLSGVDDARRTITGPDQMSWLTRGLSASEAQWKLVGNPTIGQYTLR